MINTNLVSYLKLVKIVAKLFNTNIIIDSTKIENGLLAICPVPIQNHLDDEFSKNF